MKLVLCSNLLRTHGLGCLPSCPFQSSSSHRRDLIFQKPAHKRCPLVQQSSNSNSFIILILPVPITDIKVVRRFIGGLPKPRQDKLPSHVVRRRMSSEFCFPHRLLNCACRSSSPTHHCHPVSLQVVWDPPDLGLVEGDRRGYTSPGQKTLTILHSAGSRLHHRMWKSVDIA